MAELSNWDIPAIPRPLVLADIACQASEEFVDTRDCAELALRAMGRSWAVVYAAPSGVVTLPDQQVTEADLPMLTALFDELFENDPVPPYDLQRLVDGAARRVASVNAGDVAKEE
jgi:hypothetical protein